MNKGIHRVTASSKAGRRMISVGMEVNTTRIPQEVQEWNAEVERKKEQQRRDKLKERPQTGTKT